MKANELMIGDWVQTRLWNRYEKISAIYANGVICNFRKDFDEIEPIPLTAEILEKNGFVDASSKWLEKWRYNNVYLNVYHKDNDVTIWRFMFRTGKLEDTVIYITTVHELQHALRLCGIDKTIEI